MYRRGFSETWVSQYIWIWPHDVTLWRNGICNCAHLLQSTLYTSQEIQERKNLLHFMFMFANFVEEFEESICHHRDDMQAVNWSQGAVWLLPIQPGIYCLRPTIDHRNNHWNIVTQPRKDAGYLINKVLLPICSKSCTFYCSGNY